MGKWKVINHYDEVIFDDLFDTKAEADAMVERLISTICDDEDRCFDYAVDYFEDDKLNMSYQEYMDSIDKDESGDMSNVRPVDANKVIRLCRKYFNTIEDIASRHGCFTPDLVADQTATTIVELEVDNLPTLDYAPVVHAHWIPSKKHVWRRKENGDIDTWAWEVDYHNGPVCELCNASPCEHCNPDWMELEDCSAEHYECSACERNVINKEAYCPDCGARMDEQI